MKIEQFKSQLGTASYEIFGDKILVTNFQLFPNLRQQRKSYLLFEESKEHLIEKGGKHLFIQGTEGFEGLYFKLGMRIVNKDELEKFSVWRKITFPNEKVFYSKLD